MKTPLKSVQGFSRDARSNRQIGPSYGFIININGDHIY